MRVPCSQALGRKWLSFVGEIPTAWLVQSAISEAPEYGWPCWPNNRVQDRIVSSRPRIQDNSLPLACVIDVLDHCVGSMCNSCNNKLGIWLAQWYDLTHFGNPGPDKLPQSFDVYLTWYYAAHESMDTIALTIRSIIISILTVGSAEPSTSSVTSSATPQVRWHSSADTHHRRQENFIQV